MLSKAASKRFNSKKDMGFATNTLTRSYTNRTKKALSDNVHWRISPELKKKESDLMNWYNETNRTKLHSRLLEERHELLSPIF
tara:strand:+ start:229 stop:477 length:249 start_codon:yes stop_codon:yes gene_type:complete